MRIVSGEALRHAQLAWSKGPTLDGLIDEFVDRVAERVAQLLEEGVTPHRRYGAEPELLSVSEAAELLRCKPRRVYDLRSAGRLPRTNEGGRAVVRRADLDRLVEELQWLRS